MYERLTIKESAKLNCEHCSREKKEVCSHTDCINMMYERLYQLENKMEEDHYDPGNKMKIMTNRDWLNSLSNEEFAQVFFSYNPPISKIFSIFKYFGHHTDPKRAFRQWLTQEYKEDCCIYEYFKTGNIPEQWISPSVGCLGHKEEK